MIRESCFMKAIALSLLVTVVQTGSTQDVARLDFVLNSIASGGKPQYKDSDFPIRRRVTFAKGRRARSLTIIVSGVAVVRKEGAPHGRENVPYADLVSHWTGSKLRLEEWPSPIAPPPELHITTVSGTRMVIPINRLEAEKQRYSIKQARNMVAIVANEDITELEFIVPPLLDEYSGFSRVQMFKGPYRKLDIGGRADGRTEFEFKLVQDDDDEHYQLGSPMSFEGQNVAFPGEFLLPIGKRAQQMVDRLSSRTLRCTDKSVELIVFGVAIISSTFPRYSRHNGGSGWFQDASARFDRFPGTEYTNSRSALTVKYHTQSGSVRALSPVVRSTGMMHEYRVSFTVPEDVKDRLVYLYIEDNNERYTLDNAGGFACQIVSGAEVVTVQP